MSINQSSILWLSVLLHTTTVYAENTEVEEKYTSECVESYVVKDVDNDNVYTTKDLKAAYHQLKPSIDKGIASCLLLGEGRTYKIDTNGAGKPILTFNGIKNLTIDGQNSTLLLSNRALIWEFNDSQNILVKNYQVDFDPMVFTQGIIDEVKKEQGILKVKIQKDYPSPLHPVFRIAENKKPRLPMMVIIKDNDLNGSQVEGTLNNYSVKAIDCPESMPDWATGNEQCTVRLNAGRSLEKRALALSNINVGDIYVQTANSFGGPLHRIVRSDHVIFNNIDVYGAVGIILHNNGGNFVTADNMNLIRKPGSDRYLSGVRDGMIHTNVRYGPTIINSTIESNGDDGINFHVPVLPIASYEANELVVSKNLRKRKLDAMVGDNVVITNKVTGEWFQEKIVKFDEDSQTLILENSRPEMSGSLSDWYLFNDSMFDGLNISNNKIHSTRRTPLFILSGNNGKISNNTISNSPSVALATGIEWPVGIGGRWNNMELSNNIWKDNYEQLDVSKRWPKTHILFRESEEHGIDTERPFHMNINIEGNTFTGKGRKAILDNIGNLVTKDNIGMTE